MDPIQATSHQVVASDNLSAAGQKPVTACTTCEGGRVCAALHVPSMQYKVVVWASPQVLPQPG